MSKLKLLVAFLCCYAISAFAQQTDTTAVFQTQTQPPPKQSAPIENRVYYGGTLGLSFGDYFRISLEPYVAYKVSPKASVGGKIRYEYIEDKRYNDEKLTSSNYGGSVFTRYRLIPQIYAHGEFAYMSYKYKISNLESDRSWVPFLLLGGGLVQRAGARTALYVEVLWDVLQDDNSPYDSSTPFVSVGVGVGF